MFTFIHWIYDNINISNTSLNIYLIVYLYYMSNYLLKLLVLFPIAMGLGTFLESWYSTDAARIWIYNAWWFEALMLLLMVNFMGNIKKYNLLSREKLSVLILHLSFSTRYRTWN